jgi:hypothetical protein
MTGKDMAETLMNYEALASGTGFTVLLDTDLLISPNGVEASKLAIKTVAEQRLLKAKGVAEKLKRLSEESGLLVTHPKYGKGVRADQILTQAEQCALTDLRGELENISTVVNLNEQSSD